jgi:hypothetical protein
LYLLRIQGSISFLAADPGLDYFASASVNGWKSVFELADGQLIIGIRILANFISAFPITFIAIATGLTVAGLWAIGAAVLYLLHFQLTGSHSWSFLLGVFTIVNPAASESQLGNLGGTRWLFYLIVAYSLANPKILIRLSKSRQTIVSSILFVLLLGLTNPMTFAILPGLFICFYWHRRNLNQILRKFYFSLIFTIIATTVIQLVAVFYNQREFGRQSTATYVLWAGSGFYWKFIFFAPIAVICVVTFLMARGRSKGDETKVVVLLSIQSLSVFIANYILAGIADRYLIAPYVLSFSALMFVLNNSWSVQSMFERVLSISTITVALASSVIWFSANSYLISGLDWSEQISNAKIECANKDLESVLIIFSDGNPNEVSCEYVLIEK